MPRRAKTGNREHRKPWDRICLMAERPSGLFERSFKPPGRNMLRSDSMPSRCAYPHCRTANLLHMRVAACLNQTGFTGGLGHQTEDATALDLASTQTKSMMPQRNDHEQTTPHPSPTSPDERTRPKASTRTPSNPSPSQGAPRGMSRTERKHSTIVGTGNTCGGKRPTPE